MNGVGAAGHNSNRRSNGQNMTTTNKVSSREKEKQIGRAGFGPAAWVGAAHGAFGFICMFVLVVMLVNIYIERARLVVTC